MSAGTLTYMGRAKKNATTTVRVDANLAEELEVIAEYISETTTDREATIGSLIADWSKPHIAKHRQKAIDHRIDKLKKMRESNQH